jgi:hypothetical protein
MDEKKALIPATERAQTLTRITDKPIITKHSARFNSFGFAQKPDKNNPYFGRIHKDLKECADAEFTIHEILEKVTSGYCIKPGAFKLQDYTADEQAELRELYRENFNAYTTRAAEINRSKKLELESTDLLIIDIDDRTGATDLQQVFTTSGAMALYFSFSHGKPSVFHTKQNAYRLIFQLDAAVTDEKLLKYIQEALKENLYKTFPGLLPVAGVRTGNNGIDVLGTGFFFGTNHREYMINEQHKPIHVEPYKAAFEAEQELKKYAASIKRNPGLQSTNDKEAIAMAEHLGDISGLEFKQWITLAIGLFNSAQAGVITEETALEVLQILDGNAQSDNFYMQYKRPLTDSGATASIATFIRLATDNGFKREFEDKRPTIQTSNDSGIKTEFIRQSEQHIPQQIITDILNCEERRVLLVSDTNSGKTFATIESCRTYLKDNMTAFVYYAAPTRALGGQVANKYGLGRPLQDDHNAGSFVRRAIANDSRFIAGTYDKANKVLKALPQPYNLIVVVDEAHKEVTDYNLRFRAIKQLFSITESERVTKFLALTGTPQEIDLTHYDKRCIIQRENRPEIAKELLFVEYDKTNLYTSTVTRSIAQEVSNGSKVLAFVNNKKQIEIIQKTLKKAGIKAVAVTADERKSKTYYSLLTSETIPENVQVVLATIAIADGINIQNTADYVCMIAPAKWGQATAPFFNISLIKQASNRFRHTYKRLLIPIYIKPDLDEKRLADKLHNLEGRYKWLMRDAQHIRNVIEAQFKDRLDIYRPSVAEAIAGLFNTVMAENFNFKAAYKEAENQRLGLPYNETLVEDLLQIQERLLTIDERAKRYQASKDQEEYYAYFPNAFKTAIMDITEINKISNVLVEDYLKNQAEGEKTTILDELERLEQLALLEAQEKRDQVADILTEKIFDELKTEFWLHGKINENTQLWGALRNAMHPDHSSALKTLVSFLEYEQTIKELQRIRKKAQINELRNHLKYYGDLQAFTKSETEGKKNLTQAVLTRLEQIFSNVEVSADQRRDILEAITDEFKGAKAKKTVADTFKYFFIQGESSVVWMDGKTVKVSRYSVLDIPGITRLHNFTAEEIAEMREQLEYNRRIVR